MYVEIRELPADTPNNILVAAEKEPLPLIFNAEAGAYINAIRSSLDILANALVERYGIRIREEEVYFPVVGSAAIFAGERYKGAKFVQGLPAPERTIIETLKPYDGGNDLLWTLHRLDILRKHKRLLAIATNPGTFRITGWGLSDNFTRIATGWMVNPGETVLGFLRKGAPEYKMKFTAYVGLNEPGPFARRPIIYALDKLAGLANSIIKLFDGP